MLLMTYLMTACLGCIFMLPTMLLAPRIEPSTQSVLTKCCLDK